MEFLLNLDWLAIGQIILIDILLGGDNAIVIALACRNLPANLRNKGILWGTFGAIMIRIILVAFAVTLLQVPFLKLVGGLLLFWIGVKLLTQEEDGHSKITSSDQLFNAIKTIIVADLVMSVDNVIAVASAAEQASGDHQLAMIIFGILVSIPIIVWGSTIVLRLMDRFPVIITFGAGLLGYLAGGMIVSDVAVAASVTPYLDFLRITVPGLNIQLSLPSIAGALLVIVTAVIMNKRGKSEADRQTTHHAVR